MEVYLSKSVFRGFLNPWLVRLVGGGHNLVRFVGGSQSGHPWWGRSQSGQTCWGSQSGLISGPSGSKASINPCNSKVDNRLTSFSPWGGKFRDALVKGKASKELIWDPDQKRRKGLFHL